MVNAFGLNSGKFFTKTRLTISLKMLQLWRHAIRMKTTTPDYSILSNAIIESPNETGIDGTGTIDVQIKQT
jgi:hypothetical protein